MSVSYWNVSCSIYHLLYELNLISSFSVRFEPSRTSVVKPQYKLSTGISYLQDLTADIKRF